MLTREQQTIIQKMIASAIQSYDKSRLSFRSNIRKAPPRDTKTIGSFYFQFSVTGSKGGNAALASLITQIAKSGMIIDNTT